MDEGVGLIALIEVSDGAGRPVCRFEEFLDASVRRADPVWPRDDTEAASRLQDHALQRAKAAIGTADMDKLNGHRFDVG